MSKFLIFVSLFQWVETPGLTRLVFHRLQQEDGHGELAGQRSEGRSGKTNSLRGRVSTDPVAGQFVEDLLSFKRDLWLKYCIESVTLRC
jgi:hypothetical protein